MCAISFSSRAEYHKIIYQSLLPGTQMSLKHAENKIGKPKKTMRGSKAFGRHFCGRGKYFGLVNLAVVCNIVFI